MHHGPGVIGLALTLLLYIVSASASEIPAGLQQFLPAAPLTASPPPPPAAYQSTFGGGGDSQGMAYGSALLDTQEQTGGGAISVAGDTRIVEPKDFGASGGSEAAGYAVAGPAPGDLNSLLDTQFVQQQVYHGQPVSDFSDGTSVLETSEKGTQQQQQRRHRRDDDDDDDDDYDDDRDDRDDDDDDDDDAEEDEEEDRRRHGGDKSGKGGNMALVSEKERTQVDLSTMSASQRKLFLAGQNIDTCGCVVCPCPVRCACSQCPCPEKTDDVVVPEMHEHVSVRSRSHNCGCDSCPCPVELKPEITEQLNVKPQDVYTVHPGSIDSVDDPCHCPSASICQKAPKACDNGNPPPCLCMKKQTMDDFKKQMFGQRDGFVEPETTERAHRHARIEAPVLASSTNGIVLVKAPQRRGPQTAAIPSNEVEVPTKSKDDTHVKLEQAKNIIRLLVKTIEKERKAKQAQSLQAAVDALPQNTPQQKQKQQQLPQVPQQQQPVLQQQQQQQQQQQAQQAAQKQQQNVATPQQQASPKQQPVPQLVQQAQQTAQQNATTQQKQQQQQQQQQQKAQNATAGMRFKEVSPTSDVVATAAAAVSPDAAQQAVSAVMQALSTGANVMPLAAPDATPSQATTTAAAAAGQGDSGNAKAVLLAHLPAIKELLRSNADGSAWMLKQEVAKLSTDLQQGSAAPQPPIPDPTVQLLTQQQTTDQLTSFQQVVQKMEKHMRHVESQSRKEHVVNMMLQKEIQLLAARLGEIQRNAAMTNSREAVLEEELREKGNLVRSAESNLQVVMSQLQRLLHANHAMFFRFGQEKQQLDATRETVRNGNAEDIQRLMQVAQEQLQRIKAVGDQATSSMTNLSTQVRATTQRAIEQLGTIASDVKVAGTAARNRVRAEGKKLRTELEQERYKGVHEIAKATLMAKDIVRHKLAIGRFEQDQKNWLQDNENQVQQAPTTGQLPLAARLAQVPNEANPAAVEKAEEVAIEKLKTDLDKELSDITEEATNMS